MVQKPSQETSGDPNGDHYPEGRAHWAATAEYDASHGEVSAIGGSNVVTRSNEPVILFLCTGNAARSVMGAAVLRQLSDQVVVTSAGTHSLPGLPMSTRTRTALEGVHASDPKHLSAQVDQAMVDEASLIVIFEPMHLRYMRKEHATAAARTASLPRLARDLVPGPFGAFEDRVAALDLAEHTFEAWEEVVDPAGGELPVFEEAARSIDSMVRQLACNLGLDVGAGS